jgi:hypothetical protein
MASQPTLEDIMSSEIKRDIAMRYFGFRKLIEEDELALSEKTKQCLTTPFLRVLIIDSSQEFMTNLSQKNEQGAYCGLKKYFLHQRVR